MARGNGASGFEGQCRNGASGCNPIGRTSLQAVFALAIAALIDRESYRMIRLKYRPALACFATLALALQGCTTVPEAETAAAPMAEREAARSGPGLWKVADEDTTIYLFGTIHALPGSVVWYEGPIENALAASQELVTEIPSDAARDPASQQMVMAKAMLPADQSLRDLLSETDRSTYEAALTRLGVPPAAFDRFEPWFAGMTLALMPLMKAGYAAESGVETRLEQLAPADATRSAVETLAWQIEMFDTLPVESQIAFLMVSADQVDEIAPMMDRMVAEWLEGDADGLAELMNEGLTDPVLAKTLLYDRNARWAEWVETRLEEPGTVFLAVGAGHLAGEQSLQDFLEDGGLNVIRVQ